MNQFRVALLLIALCIAVALAGCRNDNNDSNPNDVSTDTV
jgi:hypothetical protein